MAKMTPCKRAVATVGSYTDNQGNEKKRYVNVGTLFQYDDGGFALKLDSIPVNGWNGFISFYDIEAKDSKGSGRSRDDDGDSIPF